MTWAAYSSGRPSLIRPASRPLDAAQYPVVHAQQLGRAAQYALAQGRQRHRLVVALQQPAADHGLQPLDVDADRRRTAVDVLGRGAELSQPGHGMERAQQVDIQ